MTGMPLSYLASWKRSQKSEKLQEYVDTPEKWKKSRMLSKNK